MAGVPVPVMANPRQFELISRSCNLNPFLLRELKEFNKLELPTRPVGMKFINAVKKYFLQFHTFEYSTLRDKVEGVTVMLDLWETLITKFTVSGTDVSNERRIYDLLVALANRMDFDIDPVWLQWKQTKKKSMRNAVNMLLEVHIRYTRLLVLTVRLALTRVSHPVLSNNSAVSQFAMRTLAVAVLRLPFLRDRLLKIFCKFSSRRITRVRRLVEKYRERQAAIIEDGGSFDLASQAGSASSSSSRYYIMLGNNRVPTGPLSIAGSSRSLLSVSSSFSTRSSTKSALFEGAPGADMPSSSLLRNSLSTASTHSTRTSSSSARSGSRAKGSMYGWVEDLFQELDERWAQFRQESKAHDLNYADFKAKRAAAPKRKGKAKESGLPHVVRTSVQLRGHAGASDDSMYDDAKQISIPSPTPPAKGIKIKRRERMQSSASPNLSLAVSLGQPPVVVCKIKEEHPELFEWHMFDDVAMEAAEEPFNNFVTISPLGADGAEQKALAALQLRLLDTKHNDNFFEFVAAYLYHVARRTQKEVWHAVPGFLDLQKQFFVRLVDRHLTSTSASKQAASIEETLPSNQPAKRTSLDWAQSALMLNPEPNGVFLAWMCAIALKTTRLDDREKVVQTWGHLNEWCSTYVTSLRRTNKRPMLPSVLCEEALASAIMLSLRDTHFHVNFSCLLFLYNQWYHIPDEQLVDILFALVSDKQTFYRLFAHWSYAVRTMFHNCLVFIGYALRLAVNCLLASGVGGKGLEGDTPCMTPSVMVDEDSKSDILLRDNQFVRDNSVMAMQEASSSSKRNKQRENSGDASDSSGTRRQSLFSRMCCCMRGSNVSGYTTADSTSKQGMENEISLSRIAGPVESDIVRGGLKRIHSLIQGNNNQMTLDLHHQDTPNLLNTLDLNVEDLKDFLYSDLKKESKSNSIRLPSAAMGDQGQARKSIDQSSNVASILKGFSMSKLQQAVIEYDNLMHRCEQIQSFDDGYDCVIPVMVNVVPDSGMEDVLQESNRKLEMARRESFKKILAMTAAQQDDDGASVSSGGIEMAEINMRNSEDIGHEEDVEMEPMEGKKPTALLSLSRTSTSQDAELSASDGASALTEVVDSVVP